jgi:intracellular multiplication protein IcmW
MPDLSHEASALFWSEYIDPMIYRVIMFMESEEGWTLDGHPELEAAIMTLGLALDDISTIDISALGEEEKFIRLVGNIKTSRGLRVLQAIDSAQPGSASRVLMYAEQTSFSARDAAGFFLKRNILFERLRLLSRIFSEYRLRLISKVLEGEE